MIANICGFGWSGSGAYLDLLREYEETEFPSDKDWEFTFLWAPDGVIDLEHKLCKKHCRIFDSDLAIRRFLSIAKEYGRRNEFLKYDKILKLNFYKECESYVNQLVQFELKANCLVHQLHPSFSDRIILLYHNFIYNLFLRKYVSRGSRLFHKICIDNCKKMQISYQPENFLQLTQDFIEKLFVNVRSDNNKLFVLNQSFPPDMPHLCDHLIKERHKTIVVRRDPRDTFILINELGGKNKPVPKDVKNFIEFYRKTIADTIIDDDDSLLSLQFEDLIYNYERTVTKVESFLGIEKHKYKFRFFDPQKSINNTQLVKLYPKYTEKIKEIEEELKPYIFSFEGHNFDRGKKYIF